MCYLITPIGNSLITTRELEDDFLNNSNTSFYETLKGNLEFLKTFCQKNREDLKSKFSLIFNPIASNQFSLNIFHIACAIGSLEIIKLIHSFDDTIIDRPTENNLTPIHIATYFGHTEIFKYLLDSGSYALSCAVCCPYAKLNSSLSKVQKYTLTNFLSNLGRMNLLLFAIYSGNHILIEECLKRKLVLSKSEKYFIPPLSLATLLKDEKTFKIIIDSELIPIDSVDESGRTCLMIHCSFDFYPKIMNLIIDSGVNINTVDINGNSALHVMLLKGNEKMVLFFLEKANEKYNDQLKINLQLSNKLQPYTPLQIAENINPLFYKEFLKIIKMEKQDVKLALTGFNKQFKEGYLFKDSKKFWFSLDKEKLRYYKDAQNLKKPEQIIKLAKTTKVEVEKDHFKFSFLDEKGIFQDLILTASSEKETNNWYQHFQSILDKISD